MTRPAEQVSTNVMTMLRHASAYAAVMLLQGSAFLLVLPIVTRSLGPEQYGVVAVATAIMQMLAVIAPLGLTSVVAWGVYERSPDALGTARRLAATTTLIALSISAGAAALSPLWGRGLDGVSGSYAPVVAVFGAAAIAALATSQGIFQALRRPAGFALVTLLAVVGGQLLGLLLVTSGPATATRYLVGVVTGFVVAGTLGWTMLGVVPWRVTPRAQLRRSLAHGGPTVAHGIAFIILAVVDRLIVQRELGLAAAGRYQVAYLIGGVSLSALQAVNYAWAPIVYGAAPDDRWRILSETTAVVQRLAALIVGLGAMLGPYVLSLAAPASFDPSALRVTTAWIAAAAVPFALYLSGVHVLFQERRTMSLARATCTATALNVALNLVLIPRLGLSGAAAATFVAYLAWGVMVRRAARRARPVHWDTAAMWRWGALGLVLAASGAVLGTTGAGMYVRGLTVVGLGIAVLASPLLARAK